jgi:hypothetical protein
MHVDSYEAVLRYDGAAVARGRRETLVPCSVQPRDLQIIDGVRRCRFLTTPQLMEIWWPGAVPQVGRRRLTKLFAAGYLDRFRPVAQRGSFPWTYQLGREGHRLLQRAGLLDPAARHEPVDVYDYRYVLHDVHLSSWVVAWRRLLGKALLRWDGEMQVDPPAPVDRASSSEASHRAGALKDARQRPIRPDAVLEVAGRDEQRPHTFMVEYDRTRRVDKNFAKFRRYDCFASVWWRDSPYGVAERPPWVVFVCQSSEQRDLFLRSAHQHVTGRLVNVDGRVCFPGRERLLFVDEADMHAGRAVAHRLPEDPAQSLSEVERAPTVVRLPGNRPEAAAAAPPAPVATGTAA